MQRGFKFFTYLAIFALVFGSLTSSFGQTRRTAPRAASTTRTSTQQTGTVNPNGGWSGVVTFTRTLKEYYDSGKVPAFGRIDKERNYTITTRTHDNKYEGRLFVDGKGAQPVTRAQVSYSDEIKEKGKMVIVDSCHAFNDSHEFIDNSSREMITKAFGEGPARSYNLHVDEMSGRYNLSLTFPDAKGVYTDVSSLTRSGYCQPKNNEPKNSSSRQEVTERGGGFSADGMIDRLSPDVIRGSKSWESGAFKFNATWSLRRNPGELEVENIAFDEHPFPDFTDWRENTSGYIVDSNIVRVRATVVNYSQETRFPKIEFKETKENITLPDSEINISIAPGEQREVSYLWDTSGFAWGANLTKMQNREIKVELTEQRRREKTKPVNIVPKPVMLVHGLWANASAWDGYGDYLRRAYGAEWYAVVVKGMNTGEKGSLKQTNTIKQNAEILEAQIYNTQRELNAWHVDVVAHSMGGLITRYYINAKMSQVPDGKPVIQHLAMLGTPNMGSPCANLIHRTVAPFGKSVNALAELDKAFVARFNDAVRYNRGVKMSNLVGTVITPTCISPEFGDGVVEWTSGVWRLSDVRFAPEIHTKLTDEQYFRSYVLPRLAVTRHGNHLPAKEFSAALRQERSEGGGFVNASWSAAAGGGGETNEAPDFQILAGKHLELQPKGSAEIEIPAAGAGRAGVTIVAPPTVSATLLDDKGAVVGKNLSGSAEASGDFRFIPIDRPMAGAWKLKLENTGAGAAEAIVSAWTSANAGEVSFTLSAGKPDAAGRIALQAKLARRGAAIANATVTAKILDQTGEIALADDGRSGDGAANDGIYGALIDKPANEEFVVVAKTEIDGAPYQTAASAAPATSSPVKAKTSRVR